MRVVRRRSHKLSCLPAAVILVVSLTVFGLTASRATETDNDRIRAVFQAAIAHPDDPALVEAFIKELPEVPPGSNRYIVEGDIGLYRNEIKDYLYSFTKQKVEDNKSKELIVNSGPNGQFDYWVSLPSRHLTYAVDRRSFPTEADAVETSARLRDAAADWVGACPQCNISIEEKSESEAGPGFSNVTFVVRFINVKGGPIAQSFFPSSAPSDFVFSIYPDYFSPTMPFDKTGVLRHELGHILGYRHEHIGNVPGCNTEGSSWVRLTPYTPNSVMHYFCGGAGSFDLSLREHGDKDGHRCLYLTGKPCAPVSGQ
jgi:hypothetical protein